MPSSVFHYGKTTSVEKKVEMLYNKLSYFLTSGP